ncbi:hypothetical protein R3P38DRAFT_3181831 [Favolaschia claudopus]|uniref:Uncharacterized protein n=1 Tax=Favolaschia claudopus TaxID=2862362 RepID=A0AAW0CM72_9AGAR
MKLRPLEAQVEYAERERSYMAKYRAKNRLRLRQGETDRRHARYIETYGRKIFQAYLNARQANRYLAELKQRQREAYDIQDHARDEEDEAWLRGDHYLHRLEDEEEDLSDADSVHV